MNILRRSCLCILIYSIYTCIYTSFGYATQQIHHAYYFEKYDIEVVYNPAVEIAFPMRARPNPEQNITDLSYRVHEVLPFDDKDADMYLVYPEHGIVVPVHQPNYEDQKLIAEGKMFDHYPYLEEGALHYFGESPEYGPSNMIIAAHSSFKKESAGNYKTIFQALPISRPGDNIFLYIKNNAGSFDFYEYTIKESFEISMYDTQHLAATPGKYELTTYGCYEIGSNESRWKNTADLTNTILAHSDLRVHAAAPLQPEQNQPAFIATTSSASIPSRSTDAFDAELIQPHTTATNSTHTISSKQAIYATLRERNQYVIADTAPPQTLQRNIAQRIAQRSSHPVHAAASSMDKLFDLIIQKASQDKVLATKIDNKLDILIKKLEGTPGKESQLAFMQQLSTALQPYVTTNIVSVSKTTTADISSNTDEKVMVLENGKRFMSK